MRRYRRPILLLTLVFACLLSLIAYSTYRARRADVIESIELRVAQMPRGISAAEAERRIGRSPDKIAQGMGVIAQSAIMLSASNALAPNYGKPQRYEVRTWYVGPLTVHVYTDQDDRVALRTVERPQHRPPVFSRLWRFLRSLL